MKHTETPWEVRRAKTKSRFSESWREIYAGRVPVICATSYDSSRDGTICGVHINDYDAEFITCACNNHEELLRICEMLIRDIEADPMAAAYFDLRHIEAARAILAKVKKCEPQIPHQTSSASATS